MTIRKYRPEDCAEMAKLFYDTVHTVNAADYTEPQLNAWATGEVDGMDGLRRALESFRLHLEYQNSYQNLEALKILYQEFYEVLK